MIKCPFCREKMIYGYDQNRNYILMCDNDECKMIVRTKRHYHDAEDIMNDLALYWELTEEIDENGRNKIKWKGLKD
uniref:Putative restriction alleviation protein n=1 Tax=viral metagenome TaxID=1070528 RepID=A0A6M3KYQ1_9ZZZZ